MRDLSEAEMWEAIIQCNKEYDGLFFYAVKSTRICCKPSCKSKAPLKENVSFYATLSAAIQNSYRPCKRCRPNLLLSEDHEIVESIKRLIEQNYHKPFTLQEISSQVCMSKFHLQRIFKRSTGLSPLEFAMKLRIDEASNLLRSTEKNITELAHDLGYKSSAHFSTIFHKHTGMSPSEYRKVGYHED